LDEWEYLLSMATGSKLRHIIHGLQLIWDSYNETPADDRKEMAKVIFLIGCSPDSWQKFLEMAETDRARRGGGGTETFLRRFPKTGMIELSPLKDRDVKKFLIQRLKSYRTKDVSDALSPFDESYIRFISEMSFGIPSHILSLTGLIVIEASKQDAKKIDSKLGERILQQHGLLKELKEVGPSR
jgi:hypothetical protein